MAVSATGSTLWQIQYTNWFLKTPAIAADGSIVFVRGNTQLIILTPQGSEALSVTLSNEYYQTLVTPVLDAERTFYLPCAIPASLSATSADGCNKWRFSSIGSAQVTPVVGTDGTVFVGYPLQSSPTPPPAPGQISAICPDGSVRWTFNSDQAVQGYLALSADGTLLVAAGTNLLALAAEDGAQIWQMNSPTSQAFGAPVLDYDGSLYVPVADGVLALQLKAGPAHSAWPMFRQNPRQSACIQRPVDPKIHAFYPKPGCVNMEIQAAGGCIILESADLRNWSRAGIQLPSNDEVVTWSFETTNRPVGFYRLLTP
jgi:outer membrane protein assembly factor BamB